MVFHEDIRQRLPFELGDFIKAGSQLLSRQDPTIDLTPLCTAVAKGDTDDIQNLLRGGAAADAPCEDGRTPLLFAASGDIKNRAWIIQLLLARMPSTSVDATCPAVGNNTPLMFVIEKRDRESIRLLCRAGASLTVQNTRGLDAQEIAERTEDRAIIQALDPEEEERKRWMASSLVMAVLLYIVTWTADAALATYQWVSGLTIQAKEQLDKLINGEDEQDREQFIENVEYFVDENPVLSNFFQDKPYYIKELTKNVSDLEQDTSTSLGGADLLPKTVKVSLHQQVIYCDDSASMKRDNRWQAQSQLVGKIAQITTRILPVGEGVALRFINQTVEESPNLALKDIENIMEGTSWVPRGNTKIGSNLKSKILEPLVYSKLEGAGLERPLLISIITDGVPSGESSTAFLEALVECGDRLQRAGLPRDTVKFMIGQIGSAEKARKFLEDLRGNRAIADTVFVTTDQLDVRFADLHKNERDLDRWLMETLFSPFQVGLGRPNEEED